MNQMNAFAVLDTQEETVKLVSLNEALISPHSPQATLIITSQISFPASDSCHAKIKAPVRMTITVGTLAPALQAMRETTVRSILMIVLQTLVKTKALAL